MIAIAAAAVVILVFLGYAAYLRFAPARDSGIDSLAVLPFANLSHDANADYPSDGITESVIACLTRVPDLKVKSRNSAFRYKGKDVDLQKVGNEPQRIAGDIVAKLRSRLSSPEKQQVTKQGTQSPQAYELYLRGRYAWNKRTVRDLETALSYFNQAIAQDPGYALAYSGIADTFGALNSYRGTPKEDSAQAKAAALKALDLDPGLSHPHAVLAFIKIESEWNLPQGRQSTKRLWNSIPAMPRPANGTRKIWV